MSWAWEYEPSEDWVVGDAPPAFVAEVEKKAGEIARAAEALYVQGEAWQGENPKSGTAMVPCGMFEYLVIPRHERVYILQVTAW